MKYRDMLRMSCSNLWKRKIRTFLTILGVVIGTASIVVMVSLGLGLSRASMAEIEQYGGITTVNVTEQGSIFGYDEEDEKQTLGQAYGSGHLDDALLQRIQEVDHVKSAYPMLETEAIAMSGGYQGNVTVCGVPAAQADLLGLKLSQGTLMQPGTGQFEAVYGNAVLTNFYNEKTGDGYWWNGQMADIDLMEDTIMYIFNVEKYYSYLWGGTDENGQTAAFPKKYIVKTAGVMDGGPDDYYSNSNYVYCDLDVLKSTLKKEYKNTVIPGQPTYTSGKPYKEIFYTSIVVQVDDMNYVQQVQKDINALGYQAYSNAEWVQAEQKQFRYIQLALGGIGAVSLFVAAIGIANTMMMSIYERTKEIGIMKVLGCDMRNIQGMFLMEAGYIGLIGGIIGLVLSYILSGVINMLVKNMDMGMNVQVGLSYIPPWLALLALAFAVIVGMVSGFFPSLRAMRLSPLAAIRNE